MKDPVITPHLSRISTNWDLLIQARQGEGDAVSCAQRVLMRRYCGAVYRYLLAAVRDPDVAEELSQEFALRFVRGDFRRADPERGRFRDFVKTALYHLIIDHHRRRQGQPGPLPSASGRLPAAAADPNAEDAEFVSHWRGELLGRAWEALAAVEERTGQLFYTVLHWRVTYPEEPAARLAEELGGRLGRPFTEGGIRQTLRRAREKFADLLLEEVARSLETTSAERIEQELIDLGLHVYCRPALDRRGREG
jgi:RNA polymerase sigma-70 factor (ECF subfamily)